MIGTGLYGNPTWRYRVFRENRGDSAGNKQQVIQTRKDPAGPPGIRLKPALKRLLPGLDRESYHGLVHPVF